MVLPPRHGLSLCAGGGGLDMGLGLAEPGFATSCYVEIEEYPRSTLIAGQRAGYLHTAPIWDDLKRFNAVPWRGQIDTLLAGYPCQPFSQAGQRKGENDPRHLWPDIERIIEELGDGLRWCLFENVAGHLTLGLETVVRALQGMGFRVAVGLFSAEETGTSHERQRVFIVAYRGHAERRSGAATRHDCDGDNAGWPKADGGIGKCGSTMAHADGRNTGAERQQRGGQQRLHPEGGRVGLCDVDDASGERRQQVARGSHGDEGQNEGWPAKDRNQPASASPDVDHPTSPRRDGPRIRSEADLESRKRLPGEGCDELADTGEPGPQGRERRGAPDQRDRPAASGSASEFRRPLLHPPGPADMGHWRAVLDLAPDLAPAVALGDIASVAGVAAQMVAAGHMAEAEAESIVRGMADGMAARTRALRLLGNGVHPLAAAYAWRSLSYAHGLGRVDLGAAC